MSSTPWIISIGVRQRFAAEAELDGSIAVNNQQHGAGKLTMKLDMSGFIGVAAIGIEL